MPLARALVAGGLPAIEITLERRTAFEAIRAVPAEVEGAIVGAGTVLTREQFRQSVMSDARFAVSPGASADAHRRRPGDRRYRCCLAPPRPPTP